MEFNAPPSFGRHWSEAYCLIFLWIAPAGRYVVLADMCCCCQACAANCLNCDTSGAGNCDTCSDGFAAKSDNSGCEGTYHERDLVADEGNHLASYAGVTSVGDCQSHCDSTPGCRSFALCQSGPGGSGPGGCWMKDKVVTFADATSSNTDADNNRGCKTWFIQA